MPATLDSSLGEIDLFMPPYLQNATLQASKKCCTLHDVPFAAALHTASMDDVDVKTGNLLRAWREFRRMTQADLAEAFGTTPSVISLLETGERKLSPKWLHRLAPALGTSPGRLLDVHPEDAPRAQDDVFYGIPDDKLTLVKDMLNAFRAEPMNGTDG